MDSIAADTLAESRSSPLPWETDSDREHGRTDMTTGIPMTSRPVTLASLVMPIFGSSGFSLASVSAGGIARCVPRTYVFSVRPARDCWPSMSSPRGSMSARSVAGRPAWGQILFSTFHSVEKQDLTPNGGPLAGARDEEVDVGRRVRADHPGYARGRIPSLQLANLLQAFRRSDLVPCLQAEHPDIHRVEPSTGAPAEDMAV